MSNLWEFIPGKSQRVTCKTCGNTTEVPANTDVVLHKCPVADKTVGVAP